MTGTDRKNHIMAGRMKEKMKRIITVKGVGRACVRPDYITISMTVESVKKGYNEAMEDAAGRIEKIQEAVVCSGYKKEDLKTISFDVDTRYESVQDQQGSCKREFSGYAVIYRVKLSFDMDSKQLAKAIAAISESKAMPEMSIAFTVKNPAGINEALLASAAENARAKAEILCRASGNELGQLLSIDYNWGELNVISRTRYAMEDSIQPLMVRSGFTAPEIEPDDIDVSDTVTFSWEIK